MSLEEALDQVPTIAAVEFLSLVGLRPGGGDGASYEEQEGEAHGNEGATNAFRSARDLGHRSRNEDFGGARRARTRRGNVVGHHVSDDREGGWPRQVHWDPPRH